MQKSSIDFNFVKEKSFGGKIPDKIAAQFQ